VNKIKWWTIKILSLLPQKVLIFLAKRFDTPGAFELPELGHAYFMDASYYKYVRNETKEWND
jgi:hypothetical protein